MPDTKPKKPRATKPRVAAPADTAPEPKAPVVVPPTLLEDLAAVKARILDERAQYASPVEGRLTRIANDIEDAVSAVWVDAQLKERSR